MVLGGETCWLKVVVEGGETGGLMVVKLVGWCLKVGEGG